MRQWLRVPEGWLSLVLLVIMVVDVALSLQWAEWPPSLQAALAILPPTALVGVLFGFLLARLRPLPRLPAHLLGWAGGVAWVVQLSAMLQNVTTPGTGQVVHYISPALQGWKDLATELLLRLIFLGRAFFRGNAGEDIVLFIVVLALVCWLIGFLSAWFAFRSRWPWVAVGLPGFVLLLNVFYAPSVPPAYFGFYICMAITFLIYYAFRTRIAQWQAQKVRYPAELSSGVFWTGLFFSLILVLGTSFLPISASGAEKGDFWDRLFQPWREVRSTWQRLFSTVEGGAGPGRLGEYAPSFTLGGARNPPEGIALEVRTARSEYLRGITFDLYDGHGWTDTTGHVALWPMDGERPPVPSQGRVRVVQTIVPRLQGGNMVFAIAEPISVSVAAVAQLSAPVEQAGLADIVAVRTRTTPVEGSAYRVASLLSLVDKASLRQAGQDYPTWLRQRYLQLPPSLPPQVQELADQIVMAQLELGRFTLPITAGTEGVKVGFGFALGGPFIMPSGQAVYVVDVQADEGDQIITLMTTSVPGGEQVVLRVREGRAIAVSPPGALVRTGLVSPYDAAEAIEGYLRRNYTYRDDIAAPPADRDAIGYFLLESKTGYCDYFASAMVVLLRTQGVPARLARGYTGGVYDRARGSYVVPVSMAHSWPEVYFPGYGWQRFEPTAADYTTRPERPDRPPEEGNSAGSSQAGRNRPPRSRDNPQMDDEGVTFDGQSRTTPPASGWTGWWTALSAVGGLGLVALGAGVALNWRVGHGLGRLSPIAATYERMCRWAGLVRLTPSEASTPQEIAADLSAALPACRPALERLAALYTHERFGRRPALGAEVLAARQSWREVRVPLWCSPWNRLRARIRAHLEQIAARFSAPEVSE